VKRGRPPHPGPLTRRQLEAASLAAEGLTNAEIAQRLGISERGVKYHLGEVYARLEVSGRRELKDRLKGGLRGLVAGGWLRRLALGGAGIVAISAAVVAVQTTPPAEPAAISPSLPARQATATPTPSPTSTPRATPTPALTYVSGELSIPALGLRSEVALGRRRGAPEVAPEAPDLVGLDYERLPTVYGGNILWGHVDWYDGTPTAFAELHTLQRGDDVSLRLGDDGPTLRYEVLFVARGPWTWRTDPAWLDYFAGRGRSLTLLTQAGPWNGTNYEGATRVVASLVSVTPARSER
jgi:DNA-binding CsgD family transcriptional regulator